MAQVFAGLSLLVLLHGTHGSVPVDQNGDNMVSPGEFDEAFAANEDDVTPSGAVSTHGGFAVQIVKPDGKGGIEVVPEGLEILKSLGTLHVVSVVGTYHSGKSFLLNQLMGQGDAFPIGSTTAPKTAGTKRAHVSIILPAFVTEIEASVESLQCLIGGVEYPILFVDTEGFSAPNRPADYDSKVFASSAMVSSHLIYNSMHNIDQREIEHLELLTRLTQMFSVRTALQDNSTVMHFPGLTWVVEDFILEMEDGLHEIFSSVECRTLFLPTLRGKRLLAHLDEASKEPTQSLTEEYVADLEILRNSIIEALSRKEKLGHLHTGPETAELLKLVVQSANSGTLTSVPSMWEAFLKIQIEEAVKAGVGLHHKHLTTQDSAAKPLPPEAYLEACKSAEKEASRAYKQMLIGLDSPDSKAGAASLLRGLEAQSTTKAALNKERIRVYLSKSTQGILGDFQAKIEGLDTPMPSAELLSMQLEMLKQVSKAFTLETGPYGDLGDDRQRTRVNEAEGIIAAKATTNEQLLKNILEAATVAAKTAYQRGMTDVLSSHGAQCVTDAVRHQEDKRQAEKAMAEFEAGLGPAKLEDETERYRSHAMEGLRALFQAVSAENDKCIQALAKEIRDTLLIETGHAYRQLRLPLTPKDFKLATVTEYQAKFKAFQTRLKPFITSSIVVKEEAIFVDGLLERESDLRRDNLNEIKRIVRDPLKEVEKEMAFHVGEYWTVWSFKAACRTRARTKIKDQNSLSTEFVAHLEETIELWIETDLRSTRVRIRQPWVTSKLKLDLRTLYELASTLCFDLNWSTNVQYPNARPLTSKMMTITYTVVGTPALIICVALAAVLNKK